MSIHRTQNRRCIASLNFHWNLLDHVPLHVSLDPRWPDINNGPVPSWMTAPRGQTLHRSHLPQVQTHTWTPSEHTWNASTLQPAVPRHHLPGLQPHDGKVHKCLGRLHPKKGTSHTSMVQSISHQDAFHLIEANLKVGVGKEHQKISMSTE